MQDDPELTAVVRSRQLHIYRNGKKVLVLAGKSVPKIIREDSICELLQVERIKWMEQRFNNALAAIKDESAASLKTIKEDVAELSKYYSSELWKQDFAADEAGNALLYYLIFINVVTFLVYGIDKWKAKQGSWRISEATLLILAVFGGSIGALLGMKVWHHKTISKDAN